ncbi:MAG: AAA-like domain-containing protein, partial [Blastocatellia bacterium]|nr:AAA-like domain-containing protein [Blastocatellia bacterium]
MEKESQYLGMLLNNRYVIEKEIGRGGIAVIYLARDKQLLNKPVVVKLLLEKSLQQKWITTKFRQELEALARIDHPGVVGVLDFGQTEDGKPYLVMQFVEGVSLRSVMSEQGMDLTQIAYLVRQIGQALSAAHDKGVFHRDLKPENIMLQELGDDEKQVKIIDFGIARVENSQMAENTDIPVVAGTAAYISPEQLMSKPALAASDVFSFGVITYEMVTGQLPFKPKSMFQLLYLHSEGVKIKPSALRPELNKNAEEAILKALAFNTEDRYTRARDFGDYLSDVLLGITPSAKRTGKRPVIKLDNLTASEIDSVAAEPDTIRVSKIISDIPIVRKASSNLSSDSNNKVKVFITYKRNTLPDEKIANLIETRLFQEGFLVFVDKNPRFGLGWAFEIDRYLHTADFVIALVSAESVASEMFIYEIQIANEAFRKQQCTPRIIPIRINYKQNLLEPLASILDPIGYIFWSSPEDNTILINSLVQMLNEKLATELLKAFRNFESNNFSVQTTQPKLEPVGGAMPVDSKFYILRKTDEEFRTAIAEQDSIILVKGPRQTGKTSLLARGLQQARGRGAKVVLTDFQKLSAEQLTSSEKFFIAVAEMIADQLNLETSPEDFWNARRGSSINFERYIRKEILNKIDTCLVWGMDEVDRLFNCSFGSEIFGLFRSWHNERSLDPDGPWQKLTLIIAYASEAHLFITDLNQSPFNVGTRLFLEDFSFEQVTELNNRYDKPLTSSTELIKFYKLVGGHPYLVRRGLHEMVTRR